MSAKAIREVDAKKIVGYYLNTPVDVLQVTKDNISTLAAPQWALNTKLVVKPDQLIKRRGKNGLLGINVTYPEAIAWIQQRMAQPTKVDRATGYLDTFIIEPFVPHKSTSEFYVCINSGREGDEILFTHEGGVDVGDVDAKAKKLLVPVLNGKLTSEDIVKDLLTDVDVSVHAELVAFISKLYDIYVDLHFAYLEINPLVVENGTISFLDMAAKLDQTAEFIVGDKWGKPLNAKTCGFPAPFGRSLTKEEAYIAKLDSSTGASLKLTVLNATGRIWTMVAGGGASVVYADAICAHGYAHELANYGEYSGAPTTNQTYEYAKTILDLLTRNPAADGKILIIGGGIANFTNVAATFKGIIEALKEYKHKLIENKVRLFVRRGGPNYQEGLKMMSSLGETLGVPIEVFGPDSHITEVVPLALSYLGGDKAPAAPAAAATLAAAPAAAKDPLYTPVRSNSPVQPTQTASSALAAGTASANKPLLTADTQSFVFGLQPRAIQGMLDFDFACGRATPSVAAMIYPFGGHHVQKFYWGTKETLLPVFTSLEEAVQKFPEVDVVVNFASSRSVYASTLDCFKFPSLKLIGLIAEGVPERHAREILHLAKEKNVTIIGPATVGGIKPGCFRIGNTGGMMDNILSSKLYRPGSVGYVSKSGGMSNELNNILANYSDGTYEGVAIGGDRYPGTTFIDHLLRYEDDADCKMLVLLGEVGGIEEYKVIDAVRSGRITKPIVAWAIGTCAKMFTTDVQFGHAGSMANSDLETAETKNRSMKEAGFVVPDTFEELPQAIKSVYDRLVSEGKITPKKEVAPPQIPMDYKWAQELGLVRKPAAFISTISDERGQELLYAGMPISEAFTEDIGIGGVMSLLWFKRRLPDYAGKFLEMVLMLTADHGPAVSGAMNTVITTRAGKDLVSSLVSGLLTIGDRFGGALDGAAAEFTRAVDLALTPREFVDSMRKANKLIPGIGHKIKSKTNPDKRVELVKAYAKKNFPSTTMLDYALAVEEVTSAKKDTLILNVDGCIAVCFCDLLRSSGAFTKDEAEEYMKLGALNGLFVLGRSIGFIGHHLDQKRLKQPLYRHPADDIFIDQIDFKRVLVTKK